MSSHPEFRFERRGDRYRWDVRLGEIFLAELSSPDGKREWRLRAVGASAPSEAVWEERQSIPPAYGTWPERSLERVPHPVRRWAIDQIAAWTLDALAEAAQANAELRLRLESSTHQLEYQRGIHEGVAGRPYGRLDYEERKLIDADLKREIAANKAALARTRTEDKGAA